MFYNFSYLFKGVKMNEIKNKDRRDFLAKAAVAGVAIGTGTNIFGAVNKPNIACKG